MEVVVAYVVMVPLHSIRETLEIYRNLGRFHATVTNEQGTCLVCC